MSEHFDGATFDPKLDGKRLTTQKFAVLTALYSGEWLGLLDIAQKAGLSAAQLPGISARVRDLRKRAHGGHTVERRRVGDGTDGVWEYRLVLRQPLRDAEQLDMDLGAQA